MELKLGVLSESERSGETVVEVWRKPTSWSVRVPEIEVGDSAVSVLASRRR
jgi:hypothetical protein